MAIVQSLACIAFCPEALNVHPRVTSLEQLSLAEIRGE